MRTSRRYSLPLLLLCLPARAADKTAPADDFSARIMAGIAKGDLIPRVTSVEDFKMLFGPPGREESRSDGDGSVVNLSYPAEVSARFKQTREGDPAALVFVAVKGRGLDLGKPRLRDTADLLKLDRFLGLAEVSLAKIDLRESGALLAQLPFDSLTEWPTKDRLPVGFDPEKILAQGKNPGLGVRQLQREGLDGRGVGIAIVDQPLLMGHREYASRLVYYDATRVPGTGPQMHGPSVASFAVGREIGTAPGALLYYFAVPSWVPDNVPYADALRAIIELNKKAPEDRKIRVVSISSGMFKQQKNLDKWQEALLLAEKSGILVITCDPDSMDFGNLTRALDKDPDSPGSYVREAWDQRPHPLWVPGGNRTRASHKGDGIYAFDVDGGRSWSTPYLAGVAALGYQIDTALSPAKAKELLIQSATPDRNGAILNPRGFIEAVKKNAKR